MRNILEEVDEGRVSTCKSLKKCSCLWWTILLILIGGIALLPISLLCNIYYPCSFTDVSVMLSLGLMVIFSVSAYILLPWFIAWIGNYIYKKRPNQDTRPIIVVHRPRPRSPKRIPSPPRTPPPKSALKSFRETYSI